MISEHHGRDLVAAHGVATIGALLSAHLGSHEVQRDGAIALRNCLTTFREDEGDGSAVGRPPPLVSATAAAEAVAAGCVRPLLAALARVAGLPGPSLIDDGGVPTGAGAAAAVATQALACMSRGMGGGDAAAAAALGGDVLRGCGAHALVWRVRGCAPATVRCAAWWCAVVPTGTVHCASVACGHTQSPRALACACCSRVQRVEG